MRNFFFCAFVVCLVGTTAFSQVNNATLTGTVTDATKAVLPGVTITATNNATGVVVTEVSNEAGAYTIVGLIPGTYTVSADLPGFRKETYTNAEFGNGVTIRLNFTLQVASQAQNVEVTIAADTVLATSSPTTGLVMTENKVNDLPVVGNSVLDMFNVLGGIDNLVPTLANPISTNAFGREGTTVAGVSAQDVPVLRDGIMVQGTRWPTGINTNTVMNPDLVGEVRLIVTPVDAELGRGNGSVQITTRSGTNQLRGAAVWSVQNSLTNANTWTNDQSRTPLNFWNNNQGTLSAGGPIIKNKTFFYALWDMYFNGQRAYQASSVLTPCAKNGIFRYFDNWNNGAYNATTTTTGATPTIGVVDAFGNPVTPTTNPNGTPYTGKLEYISVFGPVAFSGGAPNSDCSNGTITGAAWDPFRTHPDTTGLISKTMAFFPTPTDWNYLNNPNIDGLNTASYRALKHFGGGDNLYDVGEATKSRKQINTKIDHNFNQKHRANVNITYEHVHADDVPAALPGTWSNYNFHKPMTVTGGFLSTLSPTLVNEAKFGYAVTGTNVIAPWDLAANQASINQYLPAPVNGFEILPDIAGGVGLCSPITGGRPPAVCSVGGIAGVTNTGGNLTTTAIDRSPVFTYGDSLSWTKGKHTFKGGGEIRFTSTESQGSSPGLGFFQNNRSPAVVVAGAAPGAALAVAGATAIANTNPAMSGIGANDSFKARNLLNFLSGSIQSINNEYFLNSPTQTTFSDYRTSSLITNFVNEREFSAFFKDDYKVRKNLTLNLGLRYDWYGVPFSPKGMTMGAVGGGFAAFGISGRDFTGWMNPGSRASTTSFQFVGPHSPNSGTSAYNNDWKNFGPAIGFAYQLPWLGENKTTVRGGYQITYQGGSRFAVIENPLTNNPGRVYAGSYTGTSTAPYLDLTSVTPANLPTPLPAGEAPLTPIQITDRSQAASFFDPNYTSPYVQNLTMSITRSVRPNLQVDVRYVGTLARKLYESMNLNSANFLYNGLATEFASIRAGGESQLLNQMMNGVNICVTGCTAGVTYGAIGTTVNGVAQTAAQQLRSNSAFTTNLATGNWSGVAGSLNTLDYNQSSNCPAAGAAGNCGLPAVNTSVVRGAVMRVNGFPENFIATNPQFSSATWYSNMGNTNYHSLQAEITLRPTHGFSGTMNYTWSRNLGVPPNPPGALGGSATGSFTNPVNRHMDYTIVNGNHPQILRSNGTIELPVGPGKLLLANSKGPLARAIEGWRLSGVYTISSGPWSDITSQSMLYANGVPDVANAALLKELLGDAGVKWGVRSAAGVVEGDFFDRTKWEKVEDPQCFNVTALQNLNGLATGTTPRCNLQAIARIVPQGTAGAIPNIDGKGNTGEYVLQNPQPGTQGNLGHNILRGIPPWRFDANLAKSFKIDETKSVQFRVDAFNVLNHPQPGPPNLSINTSTTPFGEITGKPAAGFFGRFVQGQLRFQF